MYYRDEEKNKKLKRERGVGFEEIVECITSGMLLGNEIHKKVEYAHQQMYIVKINNYVWRVPYYINRSGETYLITAYPSRKATKKYLQFYMT